MSTTTAPTSGIPTAYNGINFRSRLEARWAAFFDLLNWRWVYEPLDGDAYIPDFLLLGNWPIMVEVKPAASLDELRTHTAKVERGLGEVWNNDILIVGLTPFLANSWSFGWPSLGLLGEATSNGWTWDEGEWHTCAKCFAPSFHHACMSYGSRICGHNDGDRYLAPPHDALLDSRWSMACNAAQWNQRG